jgi:aminoglycoside phosphotransferase family enzyme
MLECVHAAAPSFASKLAFLRSLCGPGDEAIETHFAWVFLVAGLAWKLRKPVRRDSMDYGTLEARRLDSFEEVRLNRRLAPDVYLRAAPLSIDREGHFQFDGHGETVDWLVCMRRLDRRRQLDAVLAQGPPGSGALDGIARLLAAFYRSAVTTLPATEFLPQRLRRQAAHNHAALAGACIAGAAELAGAQQRYLDSCGDLLRQRVEAGCIVEGHGDLRPEHVFVNEHPAIIDCLEFDRDLRILDRAEELCFLELECIRLGQAGAGRQLREHCLRELDDTAPPPLLDFYRSHRAATRAKVYVWRSGELDGKDPQHWPRQAASYADCALENARRAVA